MYAVTLLIIGYNHIVYTSIFAHLFEHAPRGASQPTPSAGSSTLSVLVKAILGDV